MKTITSPFGRAIIEGWQDYQRQLVVVVRSLTPEQLAVCVAPGLRSVNEIIAHVIAGRASWFCGVLHEGDAEVDAMEEWENPGQPARTAAEYAHGLEATWNMMQGAMMRWTEAELAESMILPWIGPAHPITRSFVVWHIIEHDLHHGGEISHSLGTQGLEIKLPPPPPED